MIRQAAGAVWCLGLFLLAWVIVGSSAAPAASYRVEHNFRLRPGGNVVPRVQGTYYAHAWVQERRPDCAVFDVQPGVAAQPLGWGGFGRDYLRSRRGRVRNSGNGGGWTDAGPATYNIGAGGSANTFTANALGCRSTATANATINVNPFGARGRVTGTIRADGVAIARIRPPRSARAYAFSMAMVQAQGGRLMRNGNIRWRKVVRDIVAGRASSRRQVDPIDYTVTDKVTGDVFEGTLFSVIIEVTNSPTAGGFIWESNRVEIGARNLNFQVEFPSDKTSLQGGFNLRIRNGVVATSQSSGFYAGLLPPVGARTPLSFPLPDEVEFDYDLGDFDGHDVDVELDFHGGGETEEAAAVDDPPAITVTTPDPSTPTPVTTLTWPVTEQPYMLESSPNLTQWRPLPVEVQVVDDTVIAQVPVQPGQNEYFRLRLIEQDTTPPTFVVTPQCDLNQIIVDFSEPVDPVSLLDPLHFLLLGPLGEPLPILGVEPLGPQNVSLLVPPMPLDGQELMLMVQGVTDLAGNAVPEGTVAPVTCPPRTR